MTSTKKKFHPQPAYPNRPRFTRTLLKRLDSCIAGDWHLPGLQRPPITEHCRWVPRGAGKVRVWDIRERTRRMRADGRGHALQLAYAMAGWASEVSRIVFHKDGQVIGRRLIELRKEAGHLAERTADRGVQVLRNSGYLASEQRRADDEHRTPLPAHRQFTIDFYRDLGLLSEFEDAARKAYNKKKQADAEAASLSAQDALQALRHAIPGAAPAAPSEPTARSLGDIIGGKPPGR